MSNKIENWIDGPPKRGGWYFLEWTEGETRMIGAVHYSELLRCFWTCLSTELTDLDDPKVVIHRNARLVL